MSDLDTIFEDNVPPDHKSGVVAVVGRPNAGKSTLINAILGQKIAIVTPKPQTTRKQQLGIYTEPRAQILFVDTPGLHKPQHKLGEYMVEVAEQALRDADLVLYLIDISAPVHPGDKSIAEMLGTVRTPVVLVLNKADLAPQRDVTDYLALVPHVSAHRLSALNGDGVTELVNDLIARLAEGPRYYPIDQLSEVTLRFMAAETIREKLMLHTEQEIPHAVAVEVQEYREREDGTHYINAVIYVERDSQKGIIIGKGGEMIKRIGVEARAELETAVDAKVYIDLHVKVLKNWRSEEDLIRRLGYRIAKPDDR